MRYSAAFTVSLISCSLVLNSSFKSDIADVNAFCTIVSTSVAVITTGLVSSDLVDADPDLDDPYLNSFQEITVINNSYVQ